MSEELSVVEKVVEEVLIELMTKIVISMSKGIQDSSIRAVQDSSSTAQAEPSHLGNEKRTKHRDDLVNAKLIMSILPAYLPPLSGAVNRDSVTREFEYALVTVYLQKFIHTVRTNQ
jgi:hypothetical protein